MRRSKSKLTSGVSVQGGTWVRRTLDRNLLLGIIPAAIRRHMTVLVRRFYPTLGIPQFRTLALSTLPALFAFHFSLVASGCAGVRLSDTAAAVGLVGGAWGLPLLLVPNRNSLVWQALPRKACHA